MRAIRKLLHWIWAGLDGLFRYLNPWNYKKKG